MHAIGRLAWRTNRRTTHFRLSNAAILQPPSVPRATLRQAGRGALSTPSPRLRGEGFPRWPTSVRVDDRAQHDAAFFRVVVARTPVHRRLLVPDQQIADLPGMVIGKALLGRVRGELLDQLP